MLPVIYSASSTEFSSNGQGVLIDCLSCKVTEERNGIFEMELTYPANGQHADKLLVDAIIKATAHKGDTGQLFRIYEIDKDLDGNIEVHCQHVSYQLSFIPCAPFTAANVAAAFTALRTNMQTNDDGFTFATNKDTVATIKINVPTSAKSVLGGMEGSILDTYRGEYEFDNFDVKLWNARGQDRNVTLRYGKNITDLTQESNIAECYTGLRPYYYDEDELVELATSDKCVWCENYQSFPYKRVLILDVTGDFSDLTDEYGDKRAPTQSELLAYANSYLANHDFGEPKVSVKVEFEALWDTPEYASISNLETVNLCDTVHVLFDDLNVDVKAKVTKTVYDTLQDRYISLNIGSVTTSFTDAVAAMSEKTVDLEDHVAETYSRLEMAQQRATNTLLGLNGGYKVEKQDSYGHIIETLYMDTLDEGTATKVWRQNINGYGFSPNGPEGPYTVAITQDGEIVADFITTGTLDAGRINVANLYVGSVQYDANTTLAAHLQSMQDQIDNNVETWSGSDVPTLNNYPASDWTTTALKITHIGDVYYVNNPSSPEDGHSYRFYQSGQTFEWVLISDSDITAALQQIDALETNLSTNYYNKSATDNLFIVNNQGVLSTVSSTYSTKTEAQGYASSAQTAANNYTDSALTNYSTTSEVASAISQTADQIELSVAQTLTSYSTTTQMNTAIQQSAESILSSVSTTLEDYSTTTQMNSAIQQSASAITSTVSSTYATKTEAQNLANTAQTNATNAANSATDTKLTSYSTITQLNNQIATRVATTSYNGATIASVINQAADSVKIAAKHITLEGTVTANGNFKVNTNGTIEATGAIIKGASELQISASSESANYISIEHSKSKTTLFSSGISVWNKSTASDANTRATLNGALLGFYTGTNSSGGGGTQRLNIGPSGLFVKDTSGVTRVVASSGAIQVKDPAGTIRLSMPALATTTGHYYATFNSSGTLTSTYLQNSAIIRDDSGYIRAILNPSSLEFRNTSGTTIALFSSDPGYRCTRLHTSTSASYTASGAIASMGTIYKAFLLVCTRGQGAGAMGTTVIPLAMAKTSTSANTESWCVSAQNSSYQAKCYFDFTNNKIYLTRNNSNADCRAEVWGLR